MQPPGNQSFYRGRDRIVGGVCSGLAEGFHVDPLWVRLAFVLLAFVQGIGVLLYVVLWVLMPEQSGYRPAGQTVFESMGNDVKRAWADVRTQFGGPRPVTPSGVSATAQAAPGATPEGSTSGVGRAPVAPPVAGPPQPASRTPTFILGAILVAIGVAFLGANLHIVTWSVIWPAALIALGIALLVRNMEKRS